MDRKSRTPEEIKRDAERILGSKKKIMGVDLDVPVQSSTLPSTPPPRNLSPPPISTPTSPAEREAARLRAVNQDLRDDIEEMKKKLEELTKKKKEDEEGTNNTSIDLSVRGLNIKLVLTSVVSIVGIVLGGNATYRQLKAPPEAIAAQGTNLSFVKEDVDKAKKKEEERARYEKDRDAAINCRFGQMAAVFARQGYRLPNFPDVSVTWLQEYRESPGVVRKTPQFYPEKWCPSIPNPP